MLVICDQFTRWCEAFPVPDMTAATVAHVIVNEFIAHFGCPRRIHSDNAANFSGVLLAEVCRLLGVEKSRCSAFHPEGNSKCERMMRTILGMLSKYLDANHDEWDVHIPLFMLGYRAKVHSSLGYSPYYLIFGRDPRTPASVQIQTPSTAPKSASISEYVAKLTERIKLSHKIALEASNRRHARNKRLFDKKLTMYSFQKGDSVYLFRSVAQRGQYYKFIRPWKPAVVVKRLSDLNYRVRVLGGKKSVVVHHNRLKPRADDPTVPVAPPDFSIPSSVVSPRPETETRQQSSPPPTPRYVPFDDWYVSPSRSPPEVSDAPVTPAAAVESSAPGSLCTSRQATLRPSQPARPRFSLHLPTGYITSFTASSAPLAAKWCPVRYQTPRHTRSQCLAHGHLAINRRPPKHPASL